VTSPGGEGRRATDPEFLSRVQFALTASFHFLYPPLSMGLGLMMVVVGVAYARTKDPKWRQLSFFWVKVYGLIFALGVATGIVQEFEFGMNWADYSRFVGNVFGSLLAAEGVFAFALEGGFLGLLLFGGNRLGPRLWLFATIVVVFGAHFSALWIIMANSWMQTPQGYEIATDPAPTRAVMTNFAEVVFTPSFMPRLLHVFLASWTAGAALMMSVSAWYLLKNRHLDLARANMKVALAGFILFATANVMLFGPNMAIEVTNEQPLKLASMEGLWESTACAPLYLVGWVDEATQTTTGISIPCLLSVLAYFNPQATVQGINSFAPDPTPPINLVFQVYHFMFGLGTLFMPIGLLAGLLYWRKQRLFTARWMLWILVVTVFFVEAVIIAGWWTAEIGRQPWVVYNVLKTADGVSPTLAGIDVAVSLVMFIVLYAILLVLFLFLLNRAIQRGPEPLEEVETVDRATLPDTFREIFTRRDRAGSSGER
jgi:cytochrome d ubiquinol oxidase subunit I